MSSAKEFTQILENNYFDNDFNLEILKDGDVNVTYAVLIDSNRKYIVQMLNPFISDEMAGDYLNYQKTCSENGVKIPNLVKTKDGRSYIKTEKDQVFRVFEYVENEKPTKSVEFFEHLGEELAKLHEALAKLENPVLSTIEHFHETEFYHKKLEAVKNTDEQKYEDAKEEIDFVLENTPKYYLDESLEKTYIHGDPKLDNFLFKDNKVIAVIDFDTILKMPVYTDIGDALWSWCKNEDFTFNFDYFNASIEGYQKINPELDKQSSLNATRLIMLELASRFLIDYFEEVYFRYDENAGFNSRKEYLLHRAKEMIKLFKSTFNDK